VICKASVTFEYEMRQPDTAVIERIEAVNPNTIASRAIREARKRTKPKNWTSLVVVLERQESAELPT
jgi:hypothetical protein